MKTVVTRRGRGETSAPGRNWLRSATATATGAGPGSWLARPDSFAAFFATRQPFVLDFRESNERTQSFRKRGELSGNRIEPAVTCFDGALHFFVCHRSSIAGLKSTGYFGLRAARVETPSQPPPRSPLNQKGENPAASGHRIVSLQAHPSMRICCWCNRSAHRSDSRRRTLDVRWPPLRFAPNPTPMFFAACSVCPGMG